MGLYETKETISKAQSVQQKSNENERSSDASTACVPTNIIWAEDQQVCSQAPCDRKTQSLSFEIFTVTDISQAVSDPEEDPRTICPGL